MMSEEQYKKAEVVLILKYGSINNAIDFWLEADEDEDSEEFSMLEFFLAQPAKRK